MPDEVQLQETGQATAEVKPAPKTRKPRKIVAEELRLGSPTAIDGSKDVTLSTTTLKKYTEIVVLKPDGKTVHAVLHNTANHKVEKNPGTAIMNFVLAILNGTMAGQGLSPDGSVLWAEANYAKVLKAYPQFSKYHLRVVPAGRAGLECYISPIKVWMDAIHSRSILIGASKKSGKVKAHVTRPTKEEKPEKVEVSF